jgi:glycosyltransferase involved in cell wall biosynthesis
MRIAMLVPGLAPYDAVSNDTLGMTAALRAQGHEVAVFAPHWRDVAEDVQPHAAIGDWIRGEDDVVVYHYCIGWDFALDLFRRTKARRVVRYHNITPPEFFAGWSEGYVAACTAGRAEIDAYAALGCELYLGCSPFNLEDFIGRGVDPSRCAVLPPFHRIEELLAVTPDTRRIGNNADGAPELLMVGRIAPNKGDLALIDALTVIRRTSDPRTRLLRIGKLDPNLERYGVAVREHAHEMGADAHVVAIDDATPGELRAAYAAADALVMLSAHEGFCVPLVEAMALGTPIVAFGSSAIGWTVGDAGIVWSEPDPHLVATSIVRLHTDLMLREMLRELGRARYRAVFAPDALARTLESAFARLAA